MSTENRDGTVFSIITPITPGNYVLFNSAENDLISTVNTGDILYLSDSIDYVKVRVEAYDDVIKIFTGFVMETSLVGIVNFYFKLQNSYIDGFTRRRSIYMERYLDLLLDWTTYPKYQVNFDLPITTETITYDIMQQIRFSDPIITPDLGEYGEGWITSLSVNTKNSKISCQITFTPNFFVIPAMKQCGVIIEDQYNVDYINEDANNVDYIEDIVCG
jgi:hypothetical protein